MRQAIVSEDAETLALRALVWTLGDDDRAGRLLAVTGLDPADLRARAGERAMLAATLAFLTAQEADLVACAQALEVRPEALASGPLKAQPNPFQPLSPEGREAIMRVIGDLHDQFVAKVVAGRGLGAEVGGRRHGGEGGVERREPDQIHPRASQTGPAARMTRAARATTTMLFLSRAA